MSKKYIGLLLSALCLIQASSCKKNSDLLNNVYLSSHAMQHINLPPKSCLIAWDLNGVVFERRVSYAHMMHEMAVARKNGWGKTTKYLFKFGKLAAYKSRLKSKNDPRGYVWDAMFGTLEKNDKGKKLAAELRYFSQQANRLNITTSNILQNLELCGHTNAVLSNMGQGLVNIQIASLEKKLTTTTDQKERQNLAHCIKFLKKPTNVISSKENEWLHKPDAAAYQQFLKLNKKHNHKVTIFIDDKMRNIKAALASGFDIAILFTTADDLNTILKHLKVVQ